MVIKAFSKLLRYFLIAGVIAVGIGYITNNDLIATGLWLMLLAVLLPLPLMDLVATMHQNAKNAHYKDINGRYYGFEDLPIGVDEDPHHDRWIHIDSVRLILEGLPKNPVLQRIFKDQMVQDPIAKVHVDALIDYLRKAHDPRAIKFKRWLEKEVAMPTQNLKKRTHAAN
jgi:hypothetical protein